MAIEFDADCDWTDADQQLEDVASTLAAGGVTTEFGTPAPPPEAVDQISACPPAHTAHLQQNLAEAGRAPGRSRLQAKAGRLVDTIVLARGWTALPQQVSLAITEHSGPGEGGLWSELATDDRDGWLQDTHLQTALRRQLGAPVLAPGHSCAVAPASGPRRGTPCGVLLDTYGRHVHGQACRSGGSATRIHHAIRRRLARELRAAGLQAHEELVVPSLHLELADRVEEARMDIVCSAPGTATVWYVDVRTVDASTARASADLPAAFARAEAEKEVRYGGAAHPFALTRNGRLAASSVDLLTTLAAEAADIRQCSPTMLLRKWRRALAVVAAFEVGELVAASSRASPSPPSPPQASRPAPTALTPTQLTQLSRSRASALSRRAARQQRRLAASSASAMVPQPHALSEDQLARIAAARDVALDRRAIREAAVAEATAAAAMELARFDEEAMVAAAFVVAAA